MQPSTAPNPELARIGPRITLGAIFRISLYYGIAGFGGGYSVLAQLRRDLVERRRWLSDDDFLVIAELSKSLPGTPATSLLALLGQRVGGLRGGIVSATAFLVPSVALMILLGANYAFLRRSTGLTLFFDGMNAAMVGVVAAVTLDLGRVALRSRGAALVAIGCGVLLATRLLTEPVLALIAIIAGASHGLWRTRTAPKPAEAIAPPPRRLLSFIPLPVFLTVGTVGVLVALAQVFVPIGVTTFGGGLAMIPAMHHQAVIEHHWLGAKGFADAVALGQITPGPIAICATFIGYRAAGVAGALVATAAMFGPAIAVALAVGRSIERFHGNALVEGALHALAPAIIAMLLAATWSLGHAGIEYPLDAGVAITTFALLALKPRVSPLWPLMGGGLLHLVAARLLHIAC